MNIRNNARAFILNENNEILLQKFEFTFTGKKKILWVTPGGGVEKGETFQQALQRELFEELGISPVIENTNILSLDIPFDGQCEPFISHEVYFLLHIPKNTIFSLDNMELQEKETFHNLKWWSLIELEATNEIFEPKEEILQLLKNLK